MTDDVRALFEAAKMALRILLQDKPDDYRTQTIDDLTIALRTLERQEELGFLPGPYPLPSKVQEDRPNDPAAQ